MAKTTQHEAVTLIKTVAQQLVAEGRRGNLDDVSREFNERFGIPPGREWMTNTLYQLGYTVEGDSFWLP